MRATIASILCAVALWQNVNAQPCTDPSNAGPYAAGFRTVTLMRGTRTLDCRLYYPATAAGQNTTPSGVGAPYPVIAFGHGFSTQTSYYNSYYQHIASRGYVTIAPQFPDTQHGELALDMLACVDYLRQQNALGTSFLYHLLDTMRIGMSGHSMGGGASLLAASYDPRVLVVAPMCPAETTPSAIARMSQITGAVVLITASMDGITPPATNQIPMYDSAHAFRSKPTLIGGGHMRCMDVSSFDWLEPGPTMSRTDEQLLCRRYMTAAFDFFLKHDTCGWAWSYGAQAAADPRVSLVKETKAMQPSGFLLISPLNNGSLIPPYPFVWHRARAVSPADTVTYTVELATSSLFTTVTRRLVTRDTSHMVAADASDPPTIYWRVIASTSASTSTVSSNYGLMWWIVPVELESFSAMISGSEVILSWRTASESGNSGFEVERSVDGTTFMRIGFVPGAGTTLQPREYEFRDIPGMHAWYRLRQIDLGGDWHLSRVVMADPMPARALTMELYPSPATDKISIVCAIPEDAPTELVLHDVLGRPIRTVLTSSLVRAGTHTFSASLAGLAPGTYIATLRSGSVRASAHVVVHR